MADVKTPKQQAQNRWQALKTERSPYEDDWRDCSDYVNGARGRFQIKTSAENRRKKPIYNEEAQFASNVLASGMMAGITSPARPWFKLATPDPEMMDYAPVKIWLDDVARIMLDVLSRSNFYNAAFELYHEIGQFGVHPMLMLEDFDKVLRCENFTIGSYCLDVNGKRQVDTLYREYAPTVKQLVQRFGLDKVSHSVKKLWDEGSQTARIPCIQAIEYNTERDLESKQAKDMPYRSIHFERDNDTTSLLSESGFNEKPFVAPRWSVTGDDVYSMNYPAINCLGTNKALQIEEIDKASAIEKMHNPPLVADAALEGGVHNIAGGITYAPSLSAGNKPSVQSAYDVRMDISHLKEDIMIKEDRINRHFYADLFLMLSQMDRKQITATEIMERKEEKLLMLGPVLERLNDEFLDVAVDRCFAICQRAGILPPPPPELENVDLGIEYISVLAQAQKAVSTQSLDATIGFAMNAAQVWPEARHKINIGEAIDAYSEAKGASAKIIKGEKEFQAAVQREQQQMAAMQANEQANQAAQTAKTASETDPNSGLMEQLAQAAQR